jgi:hypothetical protein
MGWSSDGIFDNLISTLMENVPDSSARERIYEKMIPAFETLDWDTQFESVGIDDAYDAVLKRHHPTWFEDE